MQMLVNFPGDYLWLMDMDLRRGHIVAVCELKMWTVVGPRRVWAAPISKSTELLQVFQELLSVVDLLPGEPCV